MRDPRHRAARPHRELSKHTTVMVTWLAIFALSNLVQVTIGRLLTQVDPLLRSAVLIACVVPLASYGAIPALTWLAIHLRMPRQRTSGLTKDAGTQDADA